MRRRLKSNPELQSESKTEYLREDQVLILMTI
jgi:hypothetical protein